MEYAVPIALIASGVASVASLGVSVYGITQQAAAARTEADVMEWQGLLEQKRASLQERAFRLKAQKLLARQRALWSKSGVVWTEGTPLEVMEETEREVELQAAIIRAGGQAELGRLLSLADVRKQEAHAYQLGGYFRAGTSLLAEATRWLPTGPSRTLPPLEPPT